MGWMFRLRGADHHVTSDPTCLGIGDVGGWLDRTREEMRQEWFGGVVVGAALG